MPAEGRLVVSGAIFCNDCYNDVKDPYDMDWAEMSVMSRVEHGTCTCCGYVLGSEELSNPEEVVSA